MKKLTKLFGLLLVAGALLTGCQQNVDIDTDEIKLSNGKWEMNSKVVETENGKTMGLSYESSQTTKGKSTFKVSGDDMEYLSGSTSLSGKIEFPADTNDATIEFAKGMIETMLPSGTELKQEGTTFSYSYSATATEDDIKGQNEGNPKVSSMSKSLPKAARIQTNKKKTEYKISWEEESKDTTDPENPESSKTTYLYTIKKLK